MLSTISIVLKSINKAGEMPVFYERAFQTHPKDEDLARHLFFSWHREGQFKQQQVLISIIRSFGIVGLSSLLSVSLIISVILDVNIPCSVRE
tara:strand:- start:718 stop:993 length:276 start_codon:yes stop_codon:yes gene_type:complete